MDNEIRFLVIKDAGGSASSVSLPRPCLACGTPTPSTRCGPCEAERQDVVDARRGSPTARGYDAAFRRLSARARRLTPWCGDGHLGGCVGLLTADHLPGSWEKIERGEPLTLTDLEVVCAGHNARRGARRSTPPRGV